MELLMIITECTDKDRIQRSLRLGKELNRIFNINYYVSNDKFIDLFQDKNLNIINGSKISLKKIISKMNCIITDCYGIMKYPFLRSEGIPMIIDLYDMYIFKGKNFNRNFLLKNDLKIFAKCFGIGDHFIYDNSDDENYWFGMLTSYGRLNPYNYLSDNTLKNLISCVPFDFTSKDMNPLINFIKGGKKAADRILN